MNEKKYGRLIGASLGPGDPGLITRRAWEALTTGARWAYPVKGTGAASYALDIARRAGLDVPPDAEALVFPMTRQPEVLVRAWAQAAARTAALLAEGRDVVFLVEGDASIYATFAHLARTVRELAPEVEVETIPGVPSFAAAAARINEPLVTKDAMLAVLPAVYDIETIDRLIDEFDTLALLKIHPVLDDIIALLERRGLLGEACLIEKAGMPEERIVRDVATLRGKKVAYLSLMLVHNPARRNDGAGFEE